MYSPSDQTIASKWVYDTGGKMYDIKTQTKMLQCP